MDRDDARWPRWVTTLAVMAALVAVLVAVLHLTGGAPRHVVPDTGSVGVPR